MPSRAIIAVACLVIGVAAGWVARPLLSPPSPSFAAVSASVAPQAALPDQQEAADAVRRHPAGISSLAHAGVTLGSCEPQGGLARCVIELVWDDRHPGMPQHRVVTFGRISGRWEVAIW